MSDQTVTTAERQEFDVDEAMPDANGNPDKDKEVAIDLDGGGPAADDDSQVLASGAESGRSRRPRARAKVTDTGRPASDFNPTSRGDEGGEAM